MERENTLNDISDGITESVERNVSPDGSRCLDESLIVRGNNHEPIIVPTVTNVPVDGVSPQQARDELTAPENKLQQILPVQNSNATIGQVIKEKPIEKIHVDVEDCGSNIMGNK